MQKVKIIAGNVKKGLSFKSFKVNVKDYFDKIKNAEVSNHNLAFGFALGTLIAVLPTPGFGVFIAIFLAYLFRKINKPSILFSFAVWNPLMMSPVHFFSYKIGALIYPDLPNQDSNSIIQQVATFAKEYLFGNLIMAVGLSIISYLIIYKIVDILKKRHLLLHEEIKDPI